MLDAVNVLVEAGAELGARDRAWQNQREVETGLRVVDEQVSGVLFAHYRQEAIHGLHPKDVVDPS